MAVALALPGYTTLLADQLSLNPVLLAQMTKPQASKKVIASPYMACDKVAGLLLHRALLFTMMIGLEISLWKLVELQQWSNASTQSTPSNTISNYA